MPKRRIDCISTIGYNDLPDGCKDLIAQHMYAQLCHGIPGHYLDKPVGEEMQLAGFANQWAECGDPDMVRNALDDVFNNK